MEIIQGFMKREQQEKIEKYRVLNETVKKGKILFTGSSLMEQFPIHELMMNEGLGLTIYNRGVGGFTTSDMLENMEEQIFGTERPKFLSISEPMTSAMRHGHLRRFWNPCWRTMKEF